MYPQKTEKFKSIVIMDTWNPRSFLIEFFEFKFYIMLKLIIYLYINLPYFFHLLTIQRFSVREHYFAS
jgi:hypothetical protein